MELLAVSVSDVQRVRYRDRWVDTGIYKRPVSGLHRVGPRGLETDAQADLDTLTRSRTTGIGKANWRVNWLLVSLVKI